MERGPLPPHERAWRHPSELAAEERAVLRTQAAAPSTRVFALTTGTLGLLAVGVLILTVTPRRQESPIAISATTSPVVIAVPASVAPVDPEARSPALVPAFAPRGPVVDRSATGVVEVVLAAATPIGDGRFVIVTHAALDDGETEGDTVKVLMPSGAATYGDVLDVSGDAVVIEIRDDSVESGHDIAARQPDDHEIVTVMASPPITVAYRDVDELDVGEGTAVLDDEGALVGLCSRSVGVAGVRVIEITDGIDDEFTDEVDDPFSDQIDGPTSAER